MNAPMFFLALAISFAPGQDRLSPITGTNATGGQGFLSIGDPFSPIIQRAEGTGPGSKGSQFSPDLLVGGGLDKVKIDMSLDGFGIREIYFQMNASFSIVYEFEIGADSHPTRIYSLAGEKFIDTKAAKAGLAKWTFFGLAPKNKYVLVLNWEHNRGYTSMTIHGDQMSLSFRLPKDRPVP